MTRALKNAGSSLLLLCAGCAGWQSALDPQGIPAADLSRLIWLVIIICGIVWALVLVVLAAALWQRGRPLSSRPTSERHMTIAVSLAVAATVVIITFLTLASYVVTRRLTPAGEDALVIRVRGYQWWWEVTYMDARPNRTFVTANELHVPVGRLVRVELAAGDVIHSFWVPSLAGKQDLIPGRSNELTFTARAAGVYRGQCAEFCGLQHAHMAFIVIAEEPASFEAWRNAQNAEAAAPARDDEAAGREVFLSKACAACHTIRGTPASGTLGPDLTHVGGRNTIAAGLLETTRGSLAAWITDPQTLKPGNNMPAVPLNAKELNDVSAYLASLK
jgi:cytochrome c oxidase subunit 2